MKLKNERERANTQAKLLRLEALYNERSQERGGDEELRDMSMQSLKRTINQFKEEIARYEASHTVGRT